MMSGLGVRLYRSAAAFDLRVFGEAALVIVFTWLALGWTPAVAITQYDGSTLVAPYFQSALAGGADWSHNLYRFGVVGGSEMHPFAGTMPIFQVCALLGLSTTATVNTIVVFVQSCYAFLGYKLVTGWATQWTPAGAAAPVLSAPQRIVTVWLCSFAPLLGWRLAIGHDNLLIGLLPLLATMALLVSARAGTLNVAALAIGAFAAINGITGLGMQTVIYGSLFGAPAVLVTVLGAPRGQRLGRAQQLVIAALVAMILLALPRLIGMIHHATGEDASRGLGESVTYSFGANAAIDWVTSLSWIKTFAVAHVDTPYLHEHNYPVGPLIAIIAIAWPRGAGRGIWWALIGSAVVAILFADDIEPLSTGLIAVIKPLAAFRVPARAALPILVLVPPLALAALWTPRAGAPVADRRASWLAIAVAVGVFLVIRGHVPYVRELLAWGGCIAIAVVVRRGAPVGRWVLPAIAVVGALSIAAFGDRLMQHFAPDSIEGGPRELHDATLAQAPELRTALDRIEVSHPEAMYSMSDAFAARLPSLDGVWYPPSRFLTLFSALSNRPVPSTTCVFDLAHSPPFPVLQQLYNVRYVVALGGGGGQIIPLPDTLGPAWFPTTVEMIDDGRPLARAFADHHDQLKVAAAATGWLLRSDAAHIPPLAPGPACAGARVVSVATDELGQTATLVVSAPAACPLIVATNYVTALHAIGTTDGAGQARELPVFPIDIALTGIAAPAGTTTIVLAPRADVPAWTWGAWLCGLGLFGFALVACARRFPW